MRRVAILTVAIVAIAGVSILAYLRVEPRPVEKAAGVTTTRPAVTVLTLPGERKNWKALSLDKIEQLTREEMIEWLKAVRLEIGIINREGKSREEIPELIELKRALEIRLTKMGPVTGNK